MQRLDDPRIDFHSDGKEVEARLGKCIPGSFGFLIIDGMQLHPMWMDEMPLYKLGSDYPPGQPEPSKMRSGHSRRIPGNFTPSKAKAKAKKKAKRQARKKNR